MPATASTMPTMSSRSARLNVNLGVTLYSLGRRDEAKTEWESVLAEEPGNKSCRMYLDILKG